MQSRQRMVRVDSTVLTMSLVDDANRVSGLRHLSQTMQGGRILLG